MLIPFFISLLLNPKPFLLWYISQLIKCISVLAFGISLVSLLGKGYGFSISNDDIITVLKYWPEGNSFCIATITSLLFMALCSIYRQRPLKRLYCYLGINKKWESHICGSHLNFFSLFRYKNANLICVEQMVLNTTKSCLPLHYIRKYILCQHKKATLLSVELTFFKTFFTLHRKTVQGFIILIVRKWSNKLTRKEFNYA